jgi:short chain dehydrogenase
MNTHTLPAFNLSGRIALVTGASKGMGRSIAAILAQAGARVVISSRNQADCERVAAEISPDPGQCVGIASNIGEPLSTSWSAPWRSSGDRSKSGRTQSPPPPSGPIFPASSGTLLTRWRALPRACPWVGSGKPMTSQGSLFFWPHPRDPLLTVKSSGWMAARAHGKR